MNGLTELAQRRFESMLSWANSIKIVMNYEMVRYKVSSLCRFLSSFIR